MLKTIFFDNDGVLVDTEIHYFNATKVSLEEIGISLDLNEFIDLFMVKNIGTLHKIQHAGFSKDVYKKVVEKRDRLYHDLLSKNNAILPDVYDIVEKLSHKYQLCIITSSLRMHFEVIHQHTKLLPFFEIIICNEDVTKTKPHPEPYLKALEQSGFTKEEAIIIEDSQRGLISAQKANIRSIAIPGHLNQQGDFSEATYRLETIKELPALLEKL